MCLGMSGQRMTRTACDLTQSDHLHRCPLTFSASNTVVSKFGGHIVVYIVLQQTLQDHFYFHKLSFIDIEASTSDIKASTSVMK